MHLARMFPRFPILRLQNWRDQEGRDFDPMSPMPGSLFRTDTWYWAVLRARHEQVLSPTEVLFVIPDFTNLEVLVQHPVEQIAWFIRGWMEYRQAADGSWYRAYIDVHPTPEGAPH